MANDSRPDVQKKKGAPVAGAPVADNDPTLRPRLPERAVIVGAALYQHRHQLGWTRRYAAARLSITEVELTRYERGEPIMEGLYRRIMRVYVRNFTRLTQGLARQTKPGRFQ